MGIEMEMNTVSAHLRKDVTEEGKEPDISFQSSSTCSKYEIKVVAAYNKVMTVCY